MSLDLLFVAIFRLTATKVTMTAAQIPKSNFFIKFDFLVFTDIKIKGFTRCKKHFYEKNRHHEIRRGENSEGSPKIRSIGEWVLSIPIKTFRGKRY